MASLTKCWLFERHRQFSLSKRCDIGLCTCMCMRACVHACVYQPVRVTGKQTLLLTITNNFTRILCLLITSVIINAKVVPDMKVYINKRTVFDSEEMHVRWEMKSKEMRTRLREKMPNTPHIRRYRSMYRNGCRLSRHFRWTSVSYMIVLSSALFVQPQINRVCIPVCKRTQTPQQLLFIAWYFLHIK